MSTCSLLARTVTNLKDDEVVHADLPGTNVFTDAGEILVYPFHHDLCRFSGEDMLEDRSAHRLRQEQAAMI